MKFKFLDAISDTFENDLETTTVFDFDGNAILYHTWYARTYGKNEYHTKRIDKIINLCNLEDNKRKIIYLKNISFNFKNDIKYFLKLKDKIHNKFKNLFSI